MLQLLAYDLWARRLAGVDFVFTYGPLGYLFGNRPYVPEMYWWKVGVEFVSKWAAALVLLTAVMRLGTRGTRPLAMALIFLLAPLSGWEPMWFVIIAAGWPDAINCSGVVQNRTAVTMAGTSRLMVIGAASAVTGGRTPDPPTCTGFLFPAPAITGQGAAIVDPNATLAPPPTGVTLTRGAEPVTRTTTGQSGGPMVVDVRAQPGAVAATFVNLPGPVAPTPFGDLWLRIDGLVLADVALIDAGGTRAFTVPSLTVPDQLPLAFQTALLVGTTVRLTAPAVTVVGL